MENTDKADRILTAEDLLNIREHADALTYPTGAPVFTEGDEADYIYFVESGSVVVFLQKFTTRQELCKLAPGDYFGEMAVLNGGRRSASVAAVEDTVLLRADRISFHRLLDNSPRLKEGIFQNLDRRNHLTAVQELLMDDNGEADSKIEFSIKGDPSLRESVFSRERYESIVDKLIEPLCPQLEELLINRCVYSVFLHFNSGEVSTASIFDPFHEVVHAANKLIDPGYIERHFSKIDYDEKLAAVRAHYDFIAQTPSFKQLPERFLELQCHLTQPRSALTPTDIHATVSRLPLLRKMSNLYIRNIRINVVRNAIRMQFNCDGTHFVSASDYLRFLEQNLPDD